MDIKKELLWLVKSVVPVSVGFVLGIWATQIGRTSATEAHSNSIARLLASEVYLELQSTVAVAEGVARNVEHRKAVFDPQTFQLIYSPNTETFKLDEVGALNSTIVDAYVSYRQMVRVCENYRKAYIAALTSKVTDAPVTHFAYLIGLDAVTKRGQNLLSAILKQYDYQEYKLIPRYSKDLNITELGKRLGLNPKEQASTMQ